MQAPTVHNPSAPLSRRGVRVARGSRSANPIMQDVTKTGALRSYAWGPSLVNYGAITQTWEDPNVPDKVTRRR